MDCRSARQGLHDLEQGRLEAGPAALIRAHLAGCASCRREEEVERALDEALAERLSRPRAPEALRRRVAALALPPPPVRVLPGAVRAPRLLRLAAPAAVAAAALFSAGIFLGRSVGGSNAPDRLAEEVVTDHLRLLASAHPNDLESGLNHEVKPWFEGRIDFAPTIPPDGGELRLLGGAVGYVLDRKAAIASYALRRHRVTLLAFPAEGLSWPVPDHRLGGVPARSVSLHGFNAWLWRSGELGYALVSDVAAPELEQLAERFAAETVR
ncbi:MAG TPA: hypothetical protein VFG59_09495 [Anaeromyxobacter sp.]|nr:hypothetical protein [Anaeromyxobacter sp.]